MNFVLNRNYTLSSTSGRSVEFLKGEPTFVPPQMHAEVISIGAVPEDEIPYEEPAAKPVAPEDAATKEASIFAAFETLEQRNGRGDFTAGGAPNLPALTALLGWSLQPKERDIAWAKYRAAKAST